MRKQKRRSRSSHSQYTSPNESINLGDHYQSAPWRTIKPREFKVDIPQFFGKDDVEVYLDWEMKVEQLFTCHKVSEEKGESQRKREETPHTSSRTSDIKCFKCLGRRHIASQCPTKKVIIMRGHDTYSSQEETTTSSSDSEEEASEHEGNVEDTFPYEWELLIIRRLLNNQPSGAYHKGRTFFILDAKFQTMHVLSFEFKASNFTASL
uniref:CCHC-type domain-containing protein n=1 Tax=Cajanus cajan TaxID=3821 RepID=A0A151U2Z5_CAJCA|nr:hypothetical protein KK1_006350 [Cajanus cajan]